MKVQPKHLVLLALLILSRVVFATSYYFSSDGNDNNSGTTSSAPKQSIAAMQGVINQLGAGDRLLLERGSKWNNVELLLDGKSNIEISAYGTGADPILNCYTNISGGFAHDASTNLWTKTVSEFPSENYFKDVYMDGATNPVRKWNYLNFLLIGNEGSTMEKHAMGIYPNEGYMSFSNVSVINYSASPLPTFQTANLDGSTYNVDNFDGGEFRFTPALENATIVGQWLLESARIAYSSQSQLGLYTWAFFEGDKHSLIPNTLNGGGSQKGFISNHPNACDAEGEWSYNEATDVISIYSTKDLNTETIQIPTKNYALMVSSSSNISVSNIEFRGGMHYALRLSQVDGATIDNCNMEYNALGAILLDGCDQVDVTNNTIENSCANGIEVNQSGNVLMRGNTIVNIGLWPGMGGDRDINSYNGICVNQFYGNLEIDQNTITNTGYNAILLANDDHTNTCNVYITHNTITDPCSFLTDGAGIYLFDVYYNSTEQGTSDKWIKGNVLSCDVANPAIQFNQQVLHQAIYLDGYCAGFEIEDNVSYGFPNGIYLHGGYYNDVTNNKFYDWGLSESKKQAYIGCDYKYSHNTATTNYPFGNKTAYSTITNNYFVSSSADAYVGGWMFENYPGSFNPENCVVNNNAYLNPFSENSADIFKITGSNYSTDLRTYDEWKNYTGFDASSTLNQNGIDYTSSTLNSDQLIKLLYNTSFTSNRTVNLYDLSFKDIDGNTLSGSVILEPRQSKFLFYEEGTGTVSNLDLIDQMANGTTPPMEYPPYVDNLTIIGNFVSGEELELSYDFHDLNGDEEASSEFQWYLADDMTGSNATLINLATEKTYTLKTEDLGKYIRCDVIPVADSEEEPQGTLTQSAYYGPVNDEITYALNTSVQGSGTITIHPEATQYTPGAIVSLTAESTHNGWEFVTWAGDITSSHNPVNITMDSDKEVTAVFEEIAVSTQTIKMNFGFDNHPVPSDWNDLSDFPYEGHTYSNLVAINEDDELNTTNYSVSLLDSWQGHDQHGASGSGLYPDNVMRTNYRAYDDNTRRIEVSNLNPNSTYDVTVYASRNVNYAATRFIIGLDTLHIYTQDNVDITRTFNNVQLDDNSFIIECQRIAGNAAHINAIVITEHISSVPRPVAVSDAYNLTNSATLVIDAIDGLLSNDSDPLNRALEAEVINPPTCGTVSLNLNGSFSYNYTCTDGAYTDVFTYRAKVSGEDTYSEPVSVTIQVMNNAAPVAISDGYTITEGIVYEVDAVDGVLSNDTDDNLDVLTAVLHTGASNGTLTFHEDGSFEYEHDPNAVWSDEFTYQAFDGIDYSDPVSVYISVMPNSSYSLDGRINFNAGSYSNEPDWYNFSSGPANSTVNLWDNVVLTSVGSLGVGTRGDNSGCTDGIEYSYNVTDTYHFLDNTNESNTYYLDGLDNTRYYQFKFFGSRETEGLTPGEERNTIYKVLDGITGVEFPETQNAVGNTCNLTNIAQIMASSNGRIEFSIQREAGSAYGYINALEIYSKMRVDTDKDVELEGKENVNESISFYPNPVSDLLIIDNIPANCTIRIYDVIGTLKGELSNYDTNGMEVSMADYESGTYIIQVFSEQGAEISNHLIIKN